MQIPFLKRRLQTTFTFLYTRDSTLARARMQGGL
jgi:hypothetical protein